MFTMLKIFVLVVFALAVNAQRRFGGSCRNLNCASSQQCLGLYEPCKPDLVDGSTCGHYVTCLDTEGEVQHSPRPASSSTQRPASSSSVANDPKAIQRNSTDVRSSDNTGSGQLYPNLPQPDPNYPSYPQGGYYPPNPSNPQGGYYPPNPQGGYYPPNPQGGSYPPNPQGGYYPPNPQGGSYPSNPQGGSYPANPNYPAPGSGGNKKDSSDSGFSSFLNLFGGGNSGSGSSGGSSGGPDLGSLLSILGKGNSGNNSPAGSGSGGLDFSSLLSSFTGGRRESDQNNRNDYGNRNPDNRQSGGSNAPYGGNNGQTPNQAPDSGPSFLESLGNFATSPLGQQLLVNALRSRDNQNDAQQSRRFGGLFSENTSKAP